MNSGERIKELRARLKMSQEDMSQKLGITRGGLCKIEIGDRNLTRQLALAICREFRVDYYWLTEGVGDPFIGTPQSVVDEIAEDYKLDDIDKKIIEKYLDLNADQRQTIKDYLRSIFT